jgi:catechol 2,3-dioxygenase-like lactoylglutathione lyase family enzyme
VRGSVIPYLLLLSVVAILHLLLLARAGRWRPTDERRCRSGNGRLRQCCCHLPDRAGKRSVARRGRIGATTRTPGGTLMDDHADAGGDGSTGMFDRLPVRPSADDSQPGTLELGAFSVSLAVADLDASRRFYEKLGFVAVGGDADEGWLILKNGESTLGLFHGMFDRNILTFNPGLTGRMERLESFTDVRDIQERLDAAGLPLETRVEPATSGAASITLIDPDGNPVLIDQFF